VGILSGSGALVKGGGGALVVTGSGNPYTGPITLNAGLLVAADGSNDPSGSATGHGLLTLNGGTLASDPVLGGTIGGNVLAGSGANAIAPGGIGTVNILTIYGNLTLNSHTTLDFDLSGTSADLLTVGGLLSYSGSGKANVVFSGAPTNCPYPLVDFNAGTVTVGNFNPPAGYVLQISAGTLELLSAPVGPSTWIGSLGGSWTNAANWTVAPANAAGAQAVVGAGTPVPLTITLDGPQTLGQLTLANSTTGSTGYTLAAGSGGTLTLSNSGAATSADILVLSGSHGISAPVVLAENLTIVPSAGTTLDISGAISQSAAGKALELDGPGTLVLSGSDTYSGGTVVLAGTLIATAPAALLDGSKLSVGNDLSAFPGAVSAGAPVTSVAVSPVPEPGTLALLVAGLVIGFGVWRRRKRS
jgi:autotransporter-associated beta strand protein